MRMTYVPPRKNKASNIKIEDVGNNFQSDDLEGALQELAENGGSGSNIDDASTNTNKTWSANKLSAQFNTVAIEKADKSFVDTQFANIVSGAPKGTFTTVEALKIAYPGGTGGIFLVLENGHWYYWNAEVLDWLDGGVYQASQIEDNSITPSKTSFLDYTPYNLVTGIWENGYLNSTTGVFTAGSGAGWVTEYLPVIPNHYYWQGTVSPTGVATQTNSTYVKGIYLFNSNKEFVSKLTELTSAIPSNVYYIRIQLEYTTAKTTLMVVECDVNYIAPIKYINYNDDENWNVQIVGDALWNGITKKQAQIINDNGLIEGNAIGYAQLGIEKNRWIQQKTKNLINPSNIKSGIGINNSTGAEFSSATSYTSDYVKVHVGEVVKTSPYSSCDIYFYDLNKKYTKYISKLNMTIEGIAIEEDCYIRIVSNTINMYASNTGHLYNSKPNYDEKETIIHDDNIVDGVANKLEIYGSKVLTLERYNLINSENCVPGKINDDGTLTLGSGYGYYISEKINVNINDKFKLRYNYNGLYVFEYDINGTFLSKQKIVQSTEIPNLMVYTATMVNIAYIRLQADLPYQFICKYDNNVPLLSDELKNNKYRTKFSQNLYRDDILKDATTSANFKKMMLQAMYPSLVGITWNCLGDSYTANLSPANALFYYKIAKLFDMKVNNYGVVSSTYCNSYESFATRYTSMEDGAGLITVMGGVNDPYDKLGTMLDRDNTTIYGACHVLFNGLLTKYPNARIGVILQPQNGQGLDAYTSTQGGDPNLTKLRNKEEAIREVAKYYSIPVLDLTNAGGLCGLNTTTEPLYVQGDYLHLTNAGYERLTPALLEFVKALFSNF